MYPPQAKTLVVSTHRSSINLGGSLSQEDGWSQGCSNVTPAVVHLQRLGLLLEGSLGLHHYVGKLATSDSLPPNILQTWKSHRQLFRPNSGSSVWHTDGNRMNATSICIDHKLKHLWFQHIEAV